MRSQVFLGAMQMPGTLALMLLSALVTADSSAADSAASTPVVEAICRTGLPDGMLHDLAACSSALSQQVHQILH